MPEAARTLVKSPPELWAELSDPAALTRYLGAFGEIRITRLEPESTVAWEGDRASGTVDLEPAGWGTKVTVRADEAEPVAAPAEPEAEAREPEEAAEVAEPEEAPVADAPRRGFLARLFRRRARTVAPETEPAPAVAEPAPVAVEPERDPAPQPPRPDTATVLDEMLGSLGSARHRPFSRG